MAIENDFLPFATGSGANVLDQSDYAALAQLATGYQAGIAQSAALNKTWRQSSIMAAVLAQFIVDYSGQPAVDDGTTATLEANFLAALKTQLAALGGSSAQAFNVAAATASANAVNLGQFPALLSANGCVTVPTMVSGVQRNLIYQWGQANTPASASVLVTFPIAFPNAALNAVATNIQSSSTAGANGWAGVASLTKTNMYVGLTSASGTLSAAGGTSYWQAIGW